MEITEPAPPPKINKNSFNNRVSSEAGQLPGTVARSDSTDLLGASQ